MIFFGFHYTRPLSVLLQGLMGFLHQSVQVKGCGGFRTLLQEAQILDVPLRSTDGGIGQSQNTEARFPCVLQIVLQHLLVHCRVPDNALLANLLPAGFKLGLYQTGHIAAVLQNVGHRRQDQLQGNKAHVDGCKIQLVRDLLMGQVPGIGALHAHHTGVLTELPGKLAVAYIHRSRPCWLHFAAYSP